MNAPTENFYIFKKDWIMGNVITVNFSRRLSRPQKSFAEEPTRWGPPREGTLLYSIKKSFLSEAGIVKNG